MIIEYDSKYDEEIKNLYLELQEYISDIDEYGYNIVTKNYKDIYFNKTLNEIKNNDGKIYLYKEKDKIIGLISGIVNKEIDDYDFKCPKRGRILDFIVTKDYRSKGYGNLLLSKMENELKSKGCKDILIEVFAYNTSGINFYEKNNYHTRVIDMIKKID